MEPVLIAVMFLAAGAVAFSALRKVLSGKVHPERCPECGEISGRGYSKCKVCGAEL